MSDLPQVDDVAPRRRNTAKKPAAPKRAAPKAAPKGDPLNDIQVKDQLARAAQARQAALDASTATTVTDSPEVVTAPQVLPAPAVAPAPQQVVSTTGGAMLVDQSLVNILKTVKTTTFADFEGFLQELQPLVTLWQSAPHEAAARRHALSILLLIKERF